MNRLEAFNPFKRYRDAVTGRYVTRWYALANPATTVSERRRREA